MLTSLPHSNATFCATLGSQTPPRWDLCKPHIAKISIFLKKKLRKLFPKTNFFWGNLFFNFFFQILFFTLNINKFKQKWKIFFQKSILKKFKISSKKIWRNDYGQHYIFLFSIMRKKLLRIYFLKHIFYFIYLGLHSYIKWKICLRANIFLKKIYRLFSFHQTKWVYGATFFFYFFQLCFLPYKKV